MQTEESLNDLQHVAEAVYHEARSRSLHAQIGVAFSVLDRAAGRHSTSNDIPGHLAAKGQFPWWGKKQRRMDKFSEALAWKQAVMVATLAYASDDKTPLLPRPCPGNPTMFDDVRNQVRLGKPIKGCVVDGIAFWKEGE